LRFGFVGPKIDKLFGFPIFWLWTYTI